MLGVRKALGSADFAESYTGFGLSAQSFFILSFPLLSEGSLFVYAEKLCDNTYVSDLLF